MEPIKQNRQSQTDPTPSVELPAYEPPAVISYTDQQLLEALGPAQAGGIYSPFVGP